MKSSRYVLSGLSMGNVSRNAACSPTFCRLGFGTSSCRKSSYDRFWTSTRSGGASPSLSLAKLTTFIPPPGPRPPWAMRSTCSSFLNSVSWRASRPAYGGAAPGVGSLQLHLSSGGFQLLLDLLGFLFLDARLDRLGRRLHQVLGLLEAQAGDRADLL